MNEVSLIPSAAASTSGPETIWAFVFDETGVGRAVSGAPDLEAQRDSGFVWLHVDLVHANTRAWLNEIDGPLGLAADALLSQDAHPHIDWAAEFVWGIVRDVHRELSSAGEHTDELRFVVAPSFLLTGRRRPMQSAHALKRKVESGLAYESSAALFEGMLAEITDAINRVANRTAEELEEVEDRVLSPGTSDERAGLVKLRREVARYARLATSLRTVIGRLDQTGVAHLPKHCQGLTARLSQRVASLHADIHYLSDHARLLNDEVGAQVSAQANKHLFTLTVLTTLLLPPSLVTGYFGMNTKNLLFAESELGTIFATVIAAAAALAVYLIMRRNQMLGKGRL